MRNLHGEWKSASCTTMRRLRLTTAKKTLPDLKHVGTGSRGNSLHPVWYRYLMVHMFIYGLPNGTTSLRWTLYVMVEEGTLIRRQGRHFCGAKMPSERTSKKELIEYGKTEQSVR